MISAIVLLLYFNQIKTHFTEITNYKRFWYLIDYDAAKWFMSETTECMLEDSTSTGAERAADQMSALQHKSLTLLSFAVTLRKRQEVRLFVGVL